MSFCIGSFSNPNEQHSVSKEIPPAAGCRLIQWSRWDSKESMKANRMYQCCYSLYSIKLPLTTHSVIYTTVIKLR